MPVTIRTWIHYLSLPLAALVLLNPTSLPSLSGAGWRFLQLISLRFPAAAQARAKAGALASVLPFILNVSHLLFWLVLETGNSWSLVYRGICNKTILVCSSIFFWGVSFQRYSGLCTVWKIFSFSM